MTAPDTGSSPEHEAGSTTPDLGTTGEDVDLDAPAPASPGDAADSGIGTTGQDDHVEPPA
jgi:hypothetical protein